MPNPVSPPRTLRPSLVLLALVLLAAAAPAAAVERPNGVYRARPSLVLQCDDSGTCEPYLVYGTLEMTFEQVFGRTTAHIVDADLWRVPASGRQRQRFDPSWFTSLVDDVSESGVVFTTLLSETTRLDLRSFAGGDYVRLKGHLKPVGSQGPEWQFLAVVFDYLGDAPADALLLRPVPRSESELQVEVRWTDFASRSGGATPAKLDARSGAFWFFHPQNPELLVKALDGCAVNGHLWFFAAGLTNVGLEIRLSDAEAEVTKTYDNPPGRQFEPILDTRAVPCAAGGP